MINDNFSQAVNPQNGQNVTIEQLLEALKGTNNLAGMQKFEKRDGVVLCSFQYEDEIGLFLRGMRRAGIISEKNLGKYYPTSSSSMFDPLYVQKNEKGGLVLKVPVEDIQLESFVKTVKQINDSAAKMHEGTHYTYSTPFGESSPV